MKLICSILISCLLFIGQAQALNLKLYDATSFDPQPVVVSAADNSVPIGTVIIWTKEIIPDGWLECNGQPVNENLYPDLHRLMPIVPNYQGMFLRGAGNQNFTQNNGNRIGITTTKHSSGELGQIQGDSIRNIYGEVHGDSEFGRVPHKGVFRPGSSKSPYNGQEFGCDNNGLVGFFVFDASLVVPTSSENRPVNIAVKYIIKAE